MKRGVTTRVAVASIVLAVVWGIAATALASPSSTSSCSDCHALDPAVTVEAVETANDGTCATYLITVSNPFGTAGWAIVADGVNVVSDTAESESVVIPAGKTYTVWGVSKGADGDGSASVQISPAGTPPSTETVLTGKLKIHIEHRGKHKRYTLNLVNDETGEIISVTSKRSDIVLKKVPYGAYTLTLTLGTQTLTQAVVVDKSKTRICLKIPKAEKQKHRKPSHSASGGGREGGGRKGGKHR